MHEVKFRAKLTDKDEWLTGGGVVGLPDGKRVLLHLNDQQKITVTLVDAGTVGQFTGLKDKNGTEIYEGDIITIQLVGDDDWTKSCNNLFDKFTVEWAPNLAGWYPSSNNGYEPDESWWDDWTVEVIGNIYENPELVKAG
jgi:uncharacterized phage protein (TIGR01671 family)